MIVNPWGSRIIVAHLFTLILNALLIINTAVPIVFINHNFSVPHIQMFIDWDESTHWLISLNN